MDLDTEDRTSTLLEEVLTDLDEADLTKALLFSWTCYFSVQKENKRESNYFELELISSLSQNVTIYTCSTYVHIKHGWSANHNQIWTDELNKK